MDQNNSSLRKVIDENNNFPSFPLLLLFIQTNPIICRVTWTDINTAGQYEQKYAYDTHKQDQKPTVNGKEVANNKRRKKKRKPKKKRKKKTQKEKEVRADDD